MERAKALPNGGQLTSSGSNLSKHTGLSRSVETTSTISAMWDSIFADWRKVIISSFVKRITVVYSS